MSSGEHGFGKAMQLGKATGEAWTCCSAKGRLSRGSTFLQHPLQTPCISPQRCHAGSAGRSAANRIFSSCFAFKWLIATRCKTLHQQGGKRFYKSLYSEPRQQRKPPSAHTILGSKRDFGEQSKVQQHPHTSQSLHPKSQLASLFSHAAGPRYVKEQLVG